MHRSLGNDILYPIYDNILLYCNSHAKKKRKKEIHFYI